MSVPLTLLGLLEREPSHGYDLKRDYDAYFGRGKPLPFGQVYATLGRLARDGMVEPQDAEPGAGPDRPREGDDQGFRVLRFHNDPSGCVLLSTKRYRYQVHRQPGIAA